MDDYRFLKDKHGFHEEGTIDWENTYQSKLIGDSKQTRICKHENVYEWFDENGNFIGFVEGGEDDEDR